MSFLLGNIDIIIPLFVFIAAVLYFLFQHQKPVLIDKIIFVFWAGEIILNTMGGILEYYSVNNMLVYSLNVLFFALVFTIYFYRDLSGRRVKKFVLTCFGVFVLFFAVNILFIQPYYTFNSYAYAFGALLIVVYSLIGLRQLLNFSLEHDILKLKNFWFAAGILLYFGSCFFIFISYNYLTVVSKTDVGVLWKIHNLFLAVCCIIFLKAITCKEWIPK
ncbi:MAG: hypothetical protein EKK37_09285 [Sphingobacteriales bacterium]|nr:MAG: hypothetical protein EKK37_09285 [Sphingobacteriales bacterium]